MATQPIVLRPKEFDFSKLSWSIQVKSFEVNKTKMTYNSILILYNKRSDFYVKMPKMFSFGISKSTYNDKKLSTSFVLKDREGATPEQQEFQEFVEELVDRTKKWMVEHREDLGTSNLGENMLDTLSPIYIKKDTKGKVVDGAVPTLQCNMRQKGDQILTEFYEEGVDGQDDVQLNPLVFLNTETTKKFYTMVDGAASFPDVYYAKGKSSKLHCVIEEVTVQAKRERTERLTGKGGKRATLFQPSSVAAMQDDDDNNDDTQTNELTEQMESVKLAETKKSDEKTKKRDEEEEVVPKESKKKPVQESKKKPVQEESDDDDEEEEDDDEDEIPQSPVKKQTKGGIPRRGNN